MSEHQHRRRRTRCRETRLTGKQRKAIVAGSIGNAVEWVDWAVYATLAPVFAGQFFAQGRPGGGPARRRWRCSPSASSCARSAARCSGPTPTATAARRG